MGQGARRKVRACGVAAGSTENVELVITDRGQCRWQGAVVDQRCGDAGVLRSEDGTSIVVAGLPAMATCGTVVWDDDTVYASGGYPKKETVAVKADGSGEIRWRNNVKCYEQ